MKLGKKIVILRKEKGWSQNKLCEYSGIHITHLSRLENDKSQPSAELLRKIAQAFNVTMDYLVDENADEVTPVTIKDKSLANKLELIEQLDKEDQKTIINVIDSMLTKQKMINLLVKNETAK